MTAKAVSIDDLTAVRGQADAYLIISRRFMDKIIQAGAGFIGDFANNVCVRQMTFRAGKLMMVGCAPLVMHGFHAVAGSAKFRVTGLMIGKNGNGRGHDADDHTKNDNFENGTFGAAFKEHNGCTVFD